MKPSFPCVLPLCVGILTLTWSLNFKSQAQPTPPRVDAFAAVSKAISSGDLLEARAQLQTLKANGLRGDQFGRWENLAARVAVRLGDRTWLRELQKGAELSTGADELVVLAAMRLMFADRLDDAQELLDSIKEPQKMQEIPRRRYEQLQMKAAQLKGDKVAEAKWAKKLVEFVGNWDSKTCQSCHANPKAYGEQITSFDANNWWVGARYVELLKDAKSADEVVREARSELQKDAKNEGAKIKLAYALRAQGDEKAAVETLREIEWTYASDREIKKPLRFGIFP